MLINKDFCKYTQKCTTYPNNNVQKKIYTHQVEKTNYQQDSNNKP